MSICVKLKANTINHHDHTNTTRLHKSQSVNNANMAMGPILRICIESLLPPECGNGPFVGVINEHIFGHVHVTNVAAA